MTMEAYLSMITAYGCNFVIRNWGVCNGGLIAISQNNALYALLGTNFGGDGRTTFALPDLRGRSPVGEGQGPGLSLIRLGEKAGREDVTLTQTNLPSHFHGVALTGQAGPVSGDLKVSGDSANTGDPDGNYLGVGAGPIQAFTTSLSSPPGAQPDVVEIPAQPVQVTGQTNVSGGSQPFNIRNPYLGLNYQICMYGLFPPRN
jgi:microcystin-dependent protein